MAIQINTDRFKFCVGDTVKVWQIIKEKGKERTQIFEGVVIKIKKSGNPSFCVRKVATGKVGVERIWPLDSPWIKKIDVVKKGKTRRAKLYFLRELTTKKGARKLRVKGEK